MDDAEIRKVKYTSYPDCNCYVHNGFYKSALSIKDDVISTIKELKKKKPYDDYDVVITAHSYGASVGLLTSLEYFKEGINNDLYTFGSPRVGDKSFANFYTNIIKNNFRFVHDRDMVSHLPFNSMGFYHGLTEYFVLTHLVSMSLSE